MDPIEREKPLDSNNDILREVLLRLPSKSVFRFTCVSIRWNQIIVVPYFSKEYARRTRRTLGSSYPGGRLLGGMQFNLSYGHNIIPPSHKAVHRLVLVRDDEYFVGKTLNGLKLLPHKYGNPFIEKWDPLPLPPKPRGFPQKALSVGLTSDGEDGIINFRVVIATGCDEQKEETGTRVIPIETYSSRTMVWRKSKLLSDTPVAILNNRPPTVSGGFLHWFTATKRYVVAYSSSSLDEDDRRLVLHGQKKKRKNVLQVIEFPNSTGCQIIWRSENGQTMWFCTSNTIDGVAIYRKRDDSDGWALISKVECLDRMRDEILGITEEDIKNDMERVQYCRHNFQFFLTTELSREKVWTIAFMPWDPRLIIVMIMERFFIYDCKNQKMVREVKLRGQPYITDEAMKWNLYFHSLSNSTYNFRHNRPI